MSSRNILVTHALPYANGPLHIGHLLGYLQCDIWVRARHMAGDKVVFVSADDAHGTPIMLAAEKAGLAPEEFIKGVQASHERDFADFGVAYDNYYTTHSEENRELASLIYTRLRDAGHIEKRSIRQLYDPVKQMFLPDRYIKGTCPNCGTPDQYGDNCENCGATYAPTDLIDPHSVVSGATPELRDSEHYFFKVGDFTTLLRGWLAGKLTNSKPVVHSSVAAKLKEWLNAEGGVRDWDISRDAPYFGFPIPDAPGKFFYVWLDAPVGYLASFKNWCTKTGTDFDAYLAPNSTAEMHHFIGKDIVNFHGLFWPAMLHGAELRTPTALHVNGYLTVNGAKMSKSRGTFVMARTYLDAGLDADYLRYYFATILGPAPTDVDLDLKAFVDVINSHLVGKFVNIASRLAPVLKNNFSNVLAAPTDRARAWIQAIKKIRSRNAMPSSELNTLYDLPECAGFLSTNTETNEDNFYSLWPVTHERMVAYYEAGEYSKLIREWVLWADSTNQEIARYAPWSVAKDPSRLSELHTFCTIAINKFRLLSLWLSPVTPSLSQRIAEYLKCELDEWEIIESPLYSHALADFSPLATRVDPKQIEAMIEASKESLQSGAAASAPEAQKKSAKAAASAALASDKPATSVDGLISIDDFAKLDLRIGKVLACAFVDGSDKLLRFELDAGELGKRQIFSGIRAAYQEPEKLVGRNVVFIANLAPRKMRFGMSEGMILSAGSGDSDLHLLDADPGAKPGDQVK